MAREFNVPKTRELNSSPKHHGEDWTQLQKDNIKAMLHQGYDLDKICREMGRSRVSILCKLEALGLIIKHPFGYYFFVESESLATLTPYEPTYQPPEESTMTTPAPVIEVKTFIGGQDASQMTDMQIFQRIGKMESNIESLMAIKAKPQKLIAVIASMAEDITKLVEYVDGRPETDTEQYTAGDGRIFTRQVPKQA